MCHDIPWTYFPESRIAPTQKAFRYRQTLIATWNLYSGRSRQTMWSTFSPSFDILPYPFSVPMIISKTKLFRLMFTHYWPLIGNRITTDWRCFNKHKPHAGRRKGRKTPSLSLVTLTFDLWPWHSNSSERGTKHAFHVNLAQIRWAVPQIFHNHAQTKSHRRRQKKQNLKNLTQLTVYGK